jgi:hypothetical protein
MHARTTAYDVREDVGLIWIKPIECDAQFPAIACEGYYPLKAMEHTSDVPMELVIDNFCEIEHTATIHTVFGYELSRMGEVQFEVEADEDTVHCVSDGPHKKMPALFRWALGLGKDVRFVSTWSTNFSPVYLRIDHNLFDAVSGCAARVKYRAFVFITPLDATHTKVFTLVYMKSTYPGPYGGVRLVAPWFRRKADAEITRDCVVLHKLADTTPDLAGLKLSRFDRPMALNRARLDRVYRGRVATDSSNHESVSTPVDRRKSFHANGAAS